MADRDFDAKPYSADERRVCDYLRSITDDNIGCGEDPIGFLIASHAAINEIRRDLEDDLEREVARGRRLLRLKIKGTTPTP